MPGNAAQVYDTNVLTEDNELTLALLHLGYAVISPKGCRLTTEVMESWRDLYRQRLRWKRGALENLRDYGFTKVTAQYWGPQLFTLLGIVVTLAYLSSLGWSLAADSAIHLQPIWLGVTAIFVLERVVTVRSRGSLQMALAATLLVEMSFDLFLQAVHAKAIWTPSSTTRGGGDHVSARRPRSHSRHSRYRSNSCRHPPVYRTEPRLVRHRGVRAIDGGRRAAAGRSAPPGMTIRAYARPVAAILGFAGMAVLAWIGVTMLWESRSLPPQRPERKRFCVGS